MKHTSLFFLLVALGTAHGQEIAPGIPDELKASYHDWAKKKWNTSEAPFTKARKEMEAKVAAAKNSNALAALSRQLQQAYERKPLDRVALYRWAYASNEAQKETATILEQRFLSYPLLKRLHKVGLPPNYETMHLRFLIEVREEKSVRFLGLAERLLQRKPDDYPVKVFYARILAGDHSTRASRKRGLVYALRFAKEHPNDYRAYRVLSQAYSGQWTSGDDLSAIYKDTAAIQRYLQLRPNTPDAAEDRKDMAGLIRVNHIYAEKIRKGEWKPDPRPDKP